ncbi:MAG: hypothetical protein JSU94_13665 [Phycisphaerales bacterium]|nr:MAG: hypothetical protein JSU94_13665 [Phycisphaerales bacterium]
MLLTSLDAATATELLKGIDTEVVQELAVELAQLNVAGHAGDRQSLTLARQFRDSLHDNKAFHVGGFFKELLSCTAGERRSVEIQSQVRALAQRDDPFESIRSADSESLAAVLENERPLAAAVVLSELPARKHVEVLGLLAEGVRVSVAGRIRTCATMPPDAKERMAQRVLVQLQTVVTHDKNTGAGNCYEQPVRKLAVTLRGLGKELRDGLIGVMKRQDDDMGAMLAELTIVWEDIPDLDDRSLEEALGGAEVSELALALTDSKEEISAKILSNIGAETAAALKAAAAARSTAGKKDIAKARAKITQHLQEMYERGELTFIEEQYGAGHAQD